MVETYTGRLWSQVCNLASHDPLLTLLGPAFSTRPAQEHRGNFSSIYLIIYLTKNLCLGHTTNQMTQNLQEWNPSPGMFLKSSG